MDLTESISNLSKTRSLLFRQIIGFTITYIVTALQRKILAGDMDEISEKLMANRVVKMTRGKDIGTGASRTRTFRFHTKEPVGETEAGTVPLLKGLSFGRSIFGKCGAKSVIDAWDAEGAQKEKQDSSASSSVSVSAESKSKRDELM